MTDTPPPSLKLPPLRGLADLSLEILIDCIEYLQALYTPEVRGSRIRRRIPHSLLQESHLPPSDPDALNPMATLRADEFERAYAIRWLTYLTHNGDRLQGSAKAVEKITDRAAAVLANCGGASSAGVVTRKLTFSSVRGPVSVTLRDIPLAEGMASVGAQTWGGACVLAEIIATQPADFGLGLNADADDPLRVLELGAGTGLVGIAFGKLAASSDRRALVICTDAYPPALENLASNISSNFPSAPSPSSRAVSVSSHRLDWETVAQTPPELPLSEPLDAPFSLILGADIIYEAAHAQWIRICLTRLLARTPSAVFHLVIPLRSTHAAESSTVESIFGSPNDDGPRIIYRETIVCDVEASPGEEVEYAYYRIGWM